MRRVKTDANEAIIIILLALSVAWVVCSIICLLKGKYGMARSVLAFGGAMRLAHPKSYYAYWRTEDHGSGGICQAYAARAGRIHRRETAEVAPKIDAFIAERKEQKKRNV